MVNHVRNLRLVCQCVKVIVIGVVKKVDGVTVTQYIKFAKIRFVRITSYTVGLNFIMNVFKMQFGFISGIKDKESC